MALKSDEHFANIRKRIESVDPAKPRENTGIFLFKITVDQKVVKEWVMDLKNLKLVEGAPGSDVSIDGTLTISDEDFGLLVTKKLKAEEGIAAGTIKVEGNIQMLMTLGERIKAME